MGSLHNMAAVEQQVVGTTNSHRNHRMELGVGSQALPGMLVKLGSITTENPLRRKFLVCAQGEIS